MAFLFLLSVCKLRKVWPLPRMNRKVRSCVGRIRSALLAQHIGCFDVEKTLVTACDTRGGNRPMKDKPGQQR
ncbi:hypothetical protein BX600DRAFT_474180 [Xylariales sp. PMI_506]|nr:hypothetical protein BX600DRAFT_474180 [Xylariales sp. PMI_506]